MIVPLFLAICFTTTILQTSANAVSDACQDPKNKQLCDVREQLVATLFNLDEQLLHEGN